MAEQPRARLTLKAADISTLGDVETLCRAARELGMPSEGTVEVETLNHAITVTWWLDEARES